MEASTINEKQAKKTLSAKKRKKKQTIKNVLASAYDNYWPALSQEHNKQLKVILENNLPRLKHEKVNVPYDVIKKIPKTRRKNYRRVGQWQPSADAKEQGQKILLGVNDVTKLLEKNNAQCVLIASDVQPRLFVQHVIDQAVLYSVPVLIVENLRGILEKKIGIKSAVFALKSPLDPDSNLGLIQQTVCNIHTSCYPVSETHVNYDRKLKDISSITLSDSESDSEEGKEVKNHHLKRDSTKYRAFMPQKCKESDENMEIIILDDSVTNLNSPAPTPLVTKQKTPNYRPLVVKRLKGDHNRNKRKMEQLKKKN